MSEIREITIFNDPLPHVNFHFHRFNFSEGVKDVSFSLKGQVELVQELKNLSHVT